MAVFKYFQDFTEKIGKGEHQLHAAGHEIKVYLSNEQPLVSDTLKSDIAEISMTNETNHGAGGADIQNDYTESGGTASFTGVDVTFLAGAGGVGPFQFAVMVNEDHGSDALCGGWWEYDNPITLLEGESFVVDFAASIFELAIP